MHWLAQAFADFKAHREQACACNHPSAKKLSGVSLEPDSFTDLASLVLAILPHATFGDDNEGQIIIYTNKQFVSDLTGEGTDDIVEMESVE